MRATHRDNIGVFLLQWHPKPESPSRGSEQSRGRWEWKTRGILEEFLLTWLPDTSSRGLLMGLFTHPNLSIDVYPSIPIHSSKTANTSGLLCKSVAITTIYGIFWQQGSNRGCAHAQSRRKGMWLPLRSEIGFWSWLPDPRQEPQADHQFLSRPKCRLGRHEEGRAESDLQALSCVPLEHLGTCVERQKSQHRGSPCLWT